MPTLKSVLSDCNNLQGLELLLNSDAKMTIGGCGGRRFTNEALGTGSLSLSEIFKKFQELKKDTGTAESTKTIVACLEKLDKDGDTLLSSSCCLIRLLTAIRRLFGNCCFDLKASIAKAKTEIAPSTELDKKEKAAIPLSKEAQTLWDLAESFLSLNNSDEEGDSDKAEKIEAKVSQISLSDLTNLCKEIYLSKKDMLPVFTLVSYNEALSLITFSTLLDEISFFNKVAAMSLYIKEHTLDIEKKLSKYQGKPAFSYNKITIDSDTIIHEDDKVIPPFVIEHIVQSIVNSSREVVSNFKFAAYMDRQDLVRVPCGICLAFDGGRARDLMRALFSSKEMQSVQNLVSLDLNNIKSLENSDDDLISRVVDAQPHLVAIRAPKDQFQILKNAGISVAKRSDAQRDFLEAIKKSTAR